MKTGLFENNVLGGDIWKLCFHVVVWTTNTYLSENDDVTSLVLHSQFNEQNLFVSDSSVSVWTEIFLKTLIMWTQFLFRKGMSKYAFSKIPGYVPKAKES